MTKQIKVALAEPIVTNGEVITELAIYRASDAEIVDYCRRIADGERCVPYPGIGLPIEELFFSITRGDFGRLVNALNAVAPEILADTKWSVASAPTLN